MKTKFICYVLSAAFLFSLVACREDITKQENSSDKASTVQSHTDISSETDESVSEQMISSFPEADSDPEINEVQTEDGATVDIQNVHNAVGKANGIDVSKWQSKINWKSVKSEGIDFAIIRIGYRSEDGKIYRDANADYNIQQAEKAGILVGIYFFSTAISTAEAKEEAAWTVSAVAGYSISYPIVYDCEGFTSSSSRMYSLSADERTNNALAFISEVKRAGYDTMFYASKSDLQSPNLWNVPKLEKESRIWLAFYPDIPYPETKQPLYNGRYDMWQYTNRGKVSGIDQNVDLIVSYFTPEKASPKDPSKRPTDAPTPPSAEDDKIYTAANDSVTAIEVVNLRKGPSTKYEIAGELTSGTFLKRTGIGSNGWSRLEFNGQTVYAITSYLSNKVVEPIPEADIVNGVTFTATDDTVTAIEIVNLRSAPTTKSDIVASLVNGKFLKRTAIGDKGWSRLDYNGQTVYAITSYLTTSNKINSSSAIEINMMFSNASGQVTAKEETNLRTAPTTIDSEIVYTLKNGEYVERTGTSVQGWTRLTYKGQTVYAVTQFLTEK